jgi:hypothetical protein
LGALPGQQGEPAIGPDGSTNVGERCRRIVEEHCTGAADGEIEGSRKRVHLGVGTLEDDIGQTFAFGEQAGDLDH